MGFYTVDHNGQTHVDDKLVKYKRGEPIEDVKKGDLDHVGGAKYHTGDPDDEEEQED